MSNKGKKIVQDNSKNQELAATRLPLIEQLKAEFAKDRETVVYKKLSPSKIEAILDAMSYGLTIDQACHANNVTPLTFKRWRDRHPDFEEQIERAQLESYEALEARRYMILDGPFSTNEIARDKALVRAIEWAMERRGNYARKVSVSHHAALTIVNDPQELTLFTSPAGLIPDLTGEAEDGEFVEVDRPDQGSADS